MQCKTARRGNQHWVKGQMEQQARYRLARQVAPLRLLVAVPPRPRRHRLRPHRRELTSGLFLFKEMNTIFPNCSIGCVYSNCCFHVICDCSAVRFQSGWAKNRTLAASPNPTVDSPEDLMTYVSFNLTPEMGRPRQCVARSRDPCIVHGFFPQLVGQRRGRS